MKLDGKVVIVTGGAEGIGRALCQRFAYERPKALVIADINAEGAAAVAREVGGSAVSTDVSREDQVRALAGNTEAEFGPIDLFCSNAGIAIPGGLDVPGEDWDRILAINFKAHLYAARAVLPGMRARKQGYLVNVASAAGLLTQIGSAPYAVSKHAAVAFAEWIAVTYGEEGIRVSCVCPQGVRTRMLLGDDGRTDNFLVEGSISPEDVAEAVVRGIGEERFLILPHAEVAEYFRRKAADYDRWIRGMQRLQRRVFGGQPAP